MTWTSKLENKGFPRTRESFDLIEWIKDIMFPDSQEWMTEEELDDIIKDKN